jgi:hypothetical protein
MKNLPAVIIGIVIVLAVIVAGVYISQQNSSKNTQADVKTSLPLNTGN